MKLGFTNYPLLELLNKAGKNMTRKTSTSIPSKKIGLFDGSNCFLEAAVGSGVGVGALVGVRVEDGLS